MQVHLHEASGRVRTNQERECVRLKGSQRFLGRDYIH